MAITLDLHYGKPDDWKYESTVYVPISIARVIDHTETGWTMYELERQAFDHIPPEFTDARIEAGKGIESLGEHAILHAYGPDEGDYLVAITKNRQAAAETTEREKYVMAQPNFDQCDALLYEQAQIDPAALEAYDYYECMVRLGYDIMLKEAGAYALAGTVCVSGAGLEASIERVAGLAGMLTRAKHAQA